MDILDQLVTDFESLKERSKSFVELYLTCVKSDQAQEESLTPLPEAKPEQAR